MISNLWTPLTICQSRLSGIESKHRLRPLQGRISLLWNGNMLRPLRGRMHPDAYRCGRIPVMAMHLILRGAQHVASKCRGMNRFWCELIYIGFIRSRILLLWNEKTLRPLRVQNSATARHLTPEGSQHVVSESKGVNRPRRGRSRCSFFEMFWQGPRRESHFASIQKRHLRALADDSPNLSDPLIAIHHLLPRSC